MASNAASRTTAGQAVDGGRVEVRAAAARDRGVRGSGDAIVSANRRKKITPNSDTPSEPPICWKKLRELLATPMSCCGTLFCTISEVICMRKPMPTPSTTK